MSLLRWGNRDIDPLFGLTDILGDYDRQMRRMMREFNRLENQFLPDRDLNFPLEVSSLVDHSAIVPRLIEQDGKKLAQYNFDTKGFRPEDINIKTTADGRLVVSARHEDKSEDYHAVREFRRMVVIPEGLQPENMKSRLNNGVLTIEAPYTAPALEDGSRDFKELPIQHEKSQKAIK